MKLVIAHEVPGGRPPGAGGSGSIKGDVEARSEPEEGPAFGGFNDF